MAKRKTNSPSTPRAIPLLQQLWAAIKANWLIILIVVLATWLRIWRLDTHTIFFGDAAHDMWQAKQAVEQGTVPLLGIASSVPRFKQGPLTVWLEMVIYAVSGPPLIIFSLVFALISIAAVIAVYEFATVTWSRRAGLMAAAVMTISPLAVAHGRMPYHVTPIPLMLVLFLAAVWRLYHRKPQAVFWATLAWCGVFQFELAVFPLALLIPIALWRTQTKLTPSVIVQGLLGLGIGLLPQIIFDLTHNLAQLGGFGIWLGYRVVSALGITGEHGLGPSKILGTLKQYQLYGTRIFSVDNGWVAGLAGLASVTALFLALKKLSWRTLPVATGVVGLAILLLTLGYFVHGQPSEAYFPPYLVLLPLLIGWSVSVLPKLAQQIALGLIILVGVINIWQINAAEFFLSPTTTFNYSYGSSEQRDVVEYVAGRSQGHFTFATTQPAGEFPSFFDNLRWRALELNHTEAAEGELFYIEQPNSLLQTYPNVLKSSFKNVDVYQME